jgi:hypothetical protein
MPDIMGPTMAIKVLMTLLEEKRFFLLLLFVKNKKQKGRTQERHVVESAADEA